jgi:hypothetical protein
MGFTEVRPPELVAGLAIVLGISGCGRLPGAGKFAEATSKPRLG